MFDDSSIALAGLFLAIGGQYAILYSIVTKIENLRLEFALCPFHGKKGGYNGGE